MHATHPEPASVAIKPMVIAALQKAYARTAITIGVTVAPIGIGDLDVSTYALGIKE